MRNVIVNYLKEIARNKIKHRRTLMLVSMLSLVVALSVFWQLRIVGISMTGEALCGKLEHTHTLDCLVMEYVCGQEESEVHAHTGECYTSEMVQICQKEAHSHSDDCQLQREQCCEQEEHRHEDACVKTENVLICTNESEGHVHTGEPTTVTEQTCRKEEHSHGAGCYTQQERICGIEEHRHGDACIKTEKTLTCTDESEDHEHTDECFTVETVQICRKEEHTHSDDCQGEQTCTCGREEHRHGDACFETVTLPACFEVRTTQVCEKEEHTHTEGVCWVLNPCTCEKEEHQHEDACFETTDKLTCGKEESKGHSHTPECQREVNGCGYEEEHKHTLLCYSNAEADLETAADWEASLPALSGNARQDLVAVANSQIGYTESEQNYKVADDNTTKMGYTRYGEWYGNPYGNWNGMFVSFCLKYSGHPDYAKLKNTGVETMRLAAVNADKYTAVGSDAVPSAGSIVFMDKNGNGSADRAAVVTYVGSSTITVVEGDLNGAVAKMEYAMSNGTIMGYALLPPGQTAQPTEEATQPTEEATQPTEEATQPTEEATQPTEGATQPTEEATQPTEEYTLNYVCGCSGDHIADVTAQRSTFNLKREPTEPSVPTDATVHDTTCENYGKTFAGWYVKNGETGEEIDFNEDTPLVDDYADPDADGTINVYARWTATPASDTVTLTFMNGEGDSVVEFKVVGDIPQGALVWDYLPKEVPPYTGNSELPMEFAGWGRKNGETVELVTETTVADADTVLYAVFEEATSYKVYLHDMAPNGTTDYQQESSNGPIVLAAEMTLQQYLNGNSYRLHHDGKSAAECKWYIKQTVDGNETYVAYDLTAPVATELHLYTFHYTVTLTRQEATAAVSLADVEVSADGNMLTLTLREGEKPTAADFVVNGVDYSLYQWTYMDGDQQKTLDISQIIANGVTQNIVANASTDTLAIAPSATTTKNINFYAFVDGKRVLTETRNVTVYRFGDDRWYIPAATLESVYGKYGFTESQMTDGTHYFPHTDTGREKIWADTAVHESNGQYFSPIINNDNASCDVYYLPKQTLTTGNVSWSNYKKTETFYTCEVLDFGLMAYESHAEIPPRQYILTGETATVMLRDIPQESGIVWQKNGDSLTGGTSNNDGTTTYSFANVTAPIRISPYKEQVHAIRYDINIANYTPTSTAPTIKGSATFTDEIVIQQDGIYIVGTPSVSQFTVYNNNSLHAVVFLGWAINGDTDNLIPAGERLTGAQLKQYGSNIVLTAQWNRMGNDHSVSFYINLELRVADYSGSTENTPNENYTGALYGTELKIDPCPQCDEGNALSEADVIYSADQKGTAEIDAKLRQLVTGVRATYMGTERTFSLGAFPNDEAMLAKIRAAQAGYIAEFKASAFYSPNDPRNVTEYRAQKNQDNIPLYRIISIRDEDGQLRYVPESELTSENYTVRWYVLKLQNNGWHVDGVLVKKQGQLTVTKTFYGDVDAVAHVKDGYTISVKEGGVSGTLAHTLNLEQMSDTNAGGYTAYDAATDTYTWVIPLTSSKNYTLLENGYSYAGSKGNITTLAEYSIANPESGTTPTNGRVAYDETKGVTVVAKAYNVDLPYTSYQTVQFYNSYMSTDALTVSKVDDSGLPLTGVSFRLYKNVDGQQELQRIWVDGNGLYYTYDPGNTVATSTEVTGGNIAVDSHGYASVIGLATYADGHTFSLAEEVVPQGYIKVEPIEFTVTPATENAPFSINLVKSDAAELLPDGSTIRVTNTSVTMDVTVVKNWVDKTNLPVKVRLTMDGTPLNDYPEQTLSADNNWTATWEDVPVYVGGKLADYSVKETWIGSTAYNGSYTDGYNDYQVNIAQSVYVYGENALPIRATITVTNQTHMGGLSFTKVDEKGNGLAGALFQLYTVETCEHIGSGSPCEHAYGDGVWSDLHGNVNFGALAAGTYYLREIKPPAGYQDNPTVYKIVVTGSGTTITANGSNTSISTIPNVPATASLRIRKVDTDGRPLTGAKFKVLMLVDSDSNEWEEVIRDGKKEYEVVNKDGFLEVPDLLPGEYQLIEILAPAGYNRRTEPIPFTVALASIRADDTDPNNGWRIETVRDDVYIVVENAPGIELPQTGGLGTAPVVMTGLFMMAASLYVFLLRRKRERGTE